MLEAEVFICKRTPVDAADSGSVTLGKRNRQGEKEALVIDFRCAAIPNMATGGRKERRSSSGRAELTFTKSPPWIMKSFITLTVRRKTSQVILHEASENL